MRATYYKADADGFLLSTLFLTQEEADIQTGLLTEPPPPRPVVEVVPPSVADLKAAKNAAITARRVREDLRFQFLGKWFQADQPAWKQISGVHGWVCVQNTMPPGWPGQWKAEDNTFTSIPDPATWWQFYGAVLARGSSNFMRGEALKAQLNAATTPEEVEAVPVW